MAKFMILGVIGMCFINFMQKEKIWGGHGFWLTQNSWNAHAVWHEKKIWGLLYEKKNTFFHFFGPIGQTPEIFLSGLILFWPTKTMIKIFVSLRICILESITNYCEQLGSFSWSIVEDLSFPKWCILHLKWSSEEQITKLNIFSQFWLFFLCFKNWTFSLL